MTPPLDSLPSEPDALRAIIAAQAGALAQTEAELAAERRRNTLRMWRRTALDRLRDRLRERQRPERDDPNPGCYDNANAE